MLRRLSVFFSLVVVLGHLISYNSFIFAEPENNPGKQDGEIAVEITISAVGDCALGNLHGQQGGYTFNDVFNANNQDYGYFFSNALNVLGEDDLTIANLENALTKNDTRVKKTYERVFWLKGDPSYAKILAKGSVEAVSLANNHTYDYGEEGFLETKESLTREEIDYFGFEDVLIKEIKGIKIGILGFTQFDIKGKWLAYDDLKKQITDSVKTVRQATDLVIVCFHWGKENEIVPSFKQRDLAKVAIDTGADLILGHHPHVLQGIKEYKGKNIVFSLGNFSFGGNRNPHDKDTMIYQETFTFVEGKLTKTFGKVIPCSVSSTQWGNDFRPRVLEGEEAERVREKIRYRSGLIKDIGK